MNAIPPESDDVPSGRDDALDYRLLRERFEQALLVPASEREAWLDAQPMTPAQRHRLRRLLQADEANQGSLDTPPLDRAARIGDAGESDDGRSLIGQRIGGFRLLRVLGRGGMAMVFLAEREGSDFRQQVALKLLRRGLYSELEQRLFQRERRVLAALSHPNIARLIDGGVTDAGIPYLVMDRVDGVPITRHAAEHRLDVAARLALFMRICDAVATAHQHLIVHRDLKPSNILVDARGEVKLLDFGIAKLLDEDAVGTTGTGLPVLTPGYAAPEQYAGGPISTATDVYALGVLLNELLLGERPADPAHRPSTQITEQGVAIAQLPISPSALRGALGGDLDNIVLKALESEPARRYASARELGDDVERHLDGRPVAAHPPSRWYRARKFVARHRGSVLTAVLFAAAILAALGTALWQAKVARQQAQRAAEVQAFVEALFQPLERGNVLAEAPSLPELLRRGRERIDQRYPDNPEVRADLLAMFARIGDGVGETANNRALAEAAWRANAQAYGADDARSLQAQSLYAAVLRKLGEYDASLAELEAVRTVMLAQGTQGLAYARLLDSMSMTLMDQGVDPARAIALKQEALRLREADPHADAEELTTAYNNLGAAYQYARDYAQAQHWYERALERDRASNGDSLGAATTLMNIGQVQTFAGRWREGAATLREARAMFARIPVERHPNLVSLLIRLCGVEGDLETPGADATCAAAVDTARDVHGETHAQYAFALTRSARAHLAAGDVDAASDAFARARAVAASGAGDPRRLVHAIDSSQARLWWLAGDFERIRPALLSLLADIPVSPVRPVALGLVALACHRAPAPDCDPSLIEQAERALADAGGIDDVQRLPARLALAEIAWLDDQPTPAIAALETALAQAERELGASHSMVVQAHLLLSALHLQAGAWDAASRHADQAAAGLAQLSPGHPLRQRAGMYVARR
ncbi:MAG TPA: serine/threonine-protein kinase [Rhodanobacteraceae bacterium]|nr:serine/threonine-protein kinase [Rhodanobacteraceae bacterium]